MRHKKFAGLLTATLIFSTVIALSPQATHAQSTSPSSAGNGQGQGQGQGQGRMRGGFGGGRGVIGTVTEVAADHYTIKTETGDLYTVHFSANTRIMKQVGGGFRRGGQGSGQSSGQGSGQGGGQGAGEAGGDQPQAPRQPPQMLKSTDIKIGDVITTGGEVDASAKSVGAVFIMQMSPEQVARMKQMQADWGKTWLAGKVTGIQDTIITIEGTMDHQPHAIVVDENTSFRERRDSITLADIKPGEELRAEGALKNGAFTATTVAAMQPGNGQGQGGQGQGRTRNRDGGAAPNPQ
ncbi:hypothetical protein ACFPT7_11190 [Acidicapsa dinghuensis]|uniref:DUF5666 domain-containing protein n=1 Tax=Acidicapsa dinghuensis TaxID=2218256 RepID=A0ABW1EIR6_9BACT|nr:hypothetical protein [Acidicapsa dinghuensis]